MGLFGKRKEHGDLVELAKKIVIEKAAKDLTGEQKFAEGLDELITAIDKAHTYPAAWGILGKAADAVDGPLIRALAGALLQAAFDGERAAGRV